MKRTSEKGKASGLAATAKKPHNIALMMRRIRRAVERYKKAALFELAAEGFTSPFEQLVACIISIRTLDEVMLPTARSLFARARTPREVSRLTPRQIDELIRACTFHERKAQQIHTIARRLVESYDGRLPCDSDVLLSLGGVGPKCANLVLGIACGQPRIGVDVHVHRITNRWGYVQTRTPEQTTIALEEKLPRRHWVEINELLVPFGKRICTGTLPRCSECPVLEYCEQVGVTAHR
ncbi:MAG TPA: endonuclease III [Blastocatellia bacterium]|nr:endonuclease III [Blastocatellia bacterium]